ncbi:hypothetical protein Pla111_27220 [Botrimarina hoheduenensis]|uniref:Uncharacterized protein n=1 Tax=Botrimarina hoheduenensis TaxID=2528000 RepID=A0A5C5VYD3_9BACT|nr:hypothetical protein Pla111_27220 [Botrimarina hoheduenensis]
MRLGLATKGRTRNGSAQEGQTDTLTRSLARADSGGPQETENGPAEMAQRGRSAQFMLIVRAKPTQRRGSTPATLLAFPRVGFDQAWNELPQPHDFTALGFSNVKPRFSMPS